jgi:hypothetical protein
MRTIKHSQVFESSTAEIQLHMKTERMFHMLHT